ncbi:MAG TPA: methyltransferase domain-containing protein [Bryobacteraceae bacterium]|jgi:cyclopropane fatty-acyl-phospholipid synthase-like methyltransferase|nr:methyltransferase domain-containing protein [Bryobacteraceae bacterium]
MRDAIESNIRTVREHYDSLFNLVDRSRMFEAEGFTKRPPIVNMGYWSRGAKTAREAQEQFVRELASRAGSLKGKRILDAGCGLGGPATILACDYGAAVDGVNIVAQQVHWARRFADGNGVSGRVRVHLASAMDLPFPDHSFDFVFCLEAAHCFIDKPRFLRECHRVLRAGGRMLFADIVGTSHLPVVNWQPALRLNLVTASDWAKMFEAAGFSVEEKTMVGNSVYPGCRWWAAQTAAAKRKAIFNKSCKPDAAAPIRMLTKARASIQEFLYFRSVLMVMSRLKLRDFALFVASKRVPRYA